MYVDFPKFDLHVVFCEKVTELPPSPAVVMDIFDPEVRFDNLVCLVLCV